MHKVSRALALAFVVLLAGAGLAFAIQSDDLLLRIPPGWRPGTHSDDHQLSIIQLVRDGEDVNNWKELFTYMRGPKPHGLHNPEEMLDHLKAEREKECPGSTVWNVIGKDENSITYEWHSQPCLGQPEQIEMAKILFGKHSSNVVQYDKKVKELPAEERDTWLKWFGGVTLTVAH
jgi:hypothetical protein